MTSRADLDPVAAVRWLPPAFAGYAEDPATLAAAGVRGHVGALRLRFERNGGRTKLAHAYAAGPQKVHRVHYLDDALPDLAVVFIQSVGGGILQGDRLGIDITCGPGARALVTTQSATKLYRMERDYATQRIAARVERGASLELLTDYLIPYEGARLYSEVELDVDPEGTLVYTDGIAPGRAAKGERFAYERLHTRLEGHVGGKLRFADTAVLAPGERDPQRAGMLMGRTDLGSMWVVAPDAPDDLPARLHDDVRSVPGATGSASALPSGGGVSARVLGESSRSVQEALHGAWRSTREALLSVDVPRIHSVKFGKEPARLDATTRGAA